MEFWWLLRSQEHCFKTSVAHFCVTFRFIL